MLNPNPNTPPVAKHTDVVVDIETLSVQPDAIVVAIGAIGFSLDQDKGPHSVFYAEMGDSIIDEQMALDRCCDNLDWWHRQPEKVQSVLRNQSYESLRDTLNEFRMWLKACDGRVRVWGCGSDFDNVILASLYRDVGIALPWRYYDNRCFRTIRETFKDVCDAPQFSGSLHNALDDATHEARYLFKIFKQLRLMSEYANNYADQLESESQS